LLRATFVAKAEGNPKYPRHFDCPHFWLAHRADV
jgi:hypothetical protein